MGAFDSPEKADANRTILFLLLLVFKFLVPGLVYGIVPFSLLFRYGGIGRERCVIADEEYDWAIGCERQNEFLRDAWTVGLQTSLLSGVISGPMLDNLGPRMTGVLGTLMALAGVTCWGIMGEGSPGFLMYLGWGLIGMAKQPVANSVLSVVNLFPKSPGVALGIMNGFTNAGAVVPVLLNTFIELISYRRIMGGFAVGMFLSTLLGHAVLPKSPWPKRALEEPPQLETSSAKDSTSSAVVRRGPRGDSDDKKIEPSDATKDAKTGGSFLGQFFSFGNFLILTFFTVSYWRMGYYNGNLTFYLMEMSNGDKEKVKLYSLIFSYFAPCAFGGSVFMGFITDRFSFATQVFVINTAGTLLCLVTLIPYMTLQLLGFSLFVIYKSNLMGSLIYFLSETFGFEHFGKLLGFNTAIASLLGFVLYWMAHKLESTVSSRTGVLWYATAIGVFLYAAPAYLYMRQNKRKRVSAKNIHYSVTHSSLCA